ncbi:MAG: hypothetical protein BGP24_20985 [Lysobacterales bacterium 69-70]|nr:hypothetical protein [Xanthomonadaceae bacterium]ODU33820.1 MAG: hypothetical protein ABS97_10905 [Xanthomonadaceae bacterium SCN 69-320]ODV21006.1 MAG: hypothetical protein ABT27_05565 [Xanthomonadaceae bacterium SCN 69-25]OJZ01314.1 MAG: hypothetical protein BGP24_20985 [Xanthomonadales bacterium 69-70]
MTPIRPTHGTTELQSLLQHTLQHLSDAQAFYEHAARISADREVSAAFAFAVRAHAELLAALGQALPAMPLGSGAYAAVAATFDGRRPQASAAALQALHAQLLQRMERLFRDYPDMRLRAALKRHVLVLRRVGEALRRLALRQAA